MLVSLRDRLLFPFARTAVQAQSAVSWLKSKGKKAVVHFEAPFDERAILLLALYEKGRLRPDVRRMLQIAADQGLYVLAVNTLRLLPGEIENLHDIVDCYIERPNFGRDFGSYRTGFLHLIDKGWAESCPRLLMLNDSVYFSQSRTPAFLRDMMESPVEVLGATENFEIEYHLGSFCIAVDGGILRNPRFRKYWRDYSLTDVRPAVIKRGEMGLSWLLKRIATAPEGICALYSSERFVGELSRDDALLDFAIRNSRSGNNTPAKRVTVDGLIDYLKNQKLVPIILPVDGGTSGRVQVELTAEELNRRTMVSDFADVVDYIRSLLPGDAVPDVSQLRKLTAAYLAEIFMRHSQIHQNAAILLKPFWDMLPGGWSVPEQVRATAAAQDFAGFYDTLCRAAFPHHSGPFFDKTPKYMEDLGVVRARAPFIGKAVVIHRDPRAVFVSMARRLSPGMDAEAGVARNFANLTTRYLSYFLGAISHMGSPDTLFVPFEEMVGREDAWLKVLGLFADGRPFGRRQTHSRFENVISQGMDSAKVVEFDRVLSAPMQARILDATRLAALFICDPVERVRRGDLWDDLSGGADRLLQKFDLPRAGLLVDGMIFEPFAYLLRYPDVLRAGMNPVVHFQRHGRREGRRAA